MLLPFGNLLTRAKIKSEKATSSFTNHYDYRILSTIMTIILITSFWLLGWRLNTNFRFLFHFWFLNFTLYYIFHY